MLVTCQRKDVWALVNGLSLFPLCCQLPCARLALPLTVQCLSSSFHTDSAFRIQPLFRIRFEPFSVLVYFWVCRKVHLEAAWGFLCKGDEIYSLLREKQRRQGVTELYDESEEAANLSEEVHLFRRVSFMLWQFAKSGLWIKLELCPISIQLFVYNRPNKEEYTTTWDKNSFYKADCCVMLWCLLLESYFRVSCFTCYH